MTMRKPQREAEQPPQSLLVEALRDSPERKKQYSQQLSSHESLSSHSGSHMSYPEEPFVPVHSDFTIPTSNVSDFPPPESLTLEGHTERRSLFGGKVKERYGYLHAEPSSAKWPELSNDPESTFLPATIRPLHANQLRQDLTPPASPNRIRRDLISPMTPYDTSTSKSKSILTLISTLASTSTSIPTTTHLYSANKSKRALRAHETVHAQSLLLGIAFMAIWSPQNLMAPNLTEMAKEFGFSEQKRDIYLGATIALASGVLSLPISAGIGILADMCNRKYLFCITVVAGGLTSWATGASTTYQELFLARLLNGGFMSGSVPIVFSLLSDLFATSERNTASSALTAMMGMGIIFGQVYAGVVGSEQGWPHAFYVSAILTMVSAALVFFFVKEPIRGGKEEVLQDMLKHGTKYERKLTWKGFLHAMQNNKSNGILMWQGFASSVPWGIIFVFLNDYLSQERGFSVPDATYLVAVFGAGCAVGGIFGGYCGQLLMLKNRAYLPWFMAITTFLGIFPFLGLLNGHITNARGMWAILLAFTGGTIASMPSVNVRPCLINVNPPETRGAALTAANLIINIARGTGPSCITLMGAVFHVNRQFSFNVTLSVFWTLTAIQLLFLARTLPKDEDAMEAELAQYAAAALERAQVPTQEDDSTMVSIEDRMISFDGSAARESMRFVGVAIREMSAEILSGPFHCGKDEHDDDDDDEDKSDNDDDDTIDLTDRRKLWIQQQEVAWQNVKGQNRQKNCKGKRANAVDETSLLLPH